MEFIKKNPIDFFCPGHKRGRSLDPHFAELIGQIDLNNLKDTDTLHCPTTSILQAENLLAEAYGVDKSFILVGGSTSGNMASVMAVAKPNQKVIVQRNSHKSMIAGIIHTGAYPVWINPDWDEELGVFLNISYDVLEEALKNNPDSQAVFILNPTYYGTVPDIASLVNLCHAHKKIIVVDEAHGPHFHFCNELPLSAEDAGADIIVQSTHKILSALSQGSVLHMNSKRVEETRVRKALQLIQTTSPSFPIMASIDLARKQMVFEGEERLKKVILMAREARQRIREIPGCSLLERPLKQDKGVGFFDLDETKILINVSHLAVTGYDFLNMLNQEFNIQPEVAGPSYILCILTIGTIQKDLDYLVNGCALLAKKAQSKSSQKVISSKQMAEQGRKLSSSPILCMSPREAFYSNTKDVPLKKSNGHICAEVVTPYPPGIPLLMPGERITEEIINFLLEVRALGNPISSTDPSINTIQVVI